MELVSGHWKIGHQDTFSRSNWPKAWPFKPQIYEAYPQCAPDFHKCEDAHDWYYFFACVFSDCQALKRPLVLDLFLGPLCLRWSPPRHRNVPTNVLCREPTFCRGKWCSLHALRQKYLSQTRPGYHAQPRQPPAPRATFADRLRIASYNVGGLNAHTYAQLTQYLDLPPSYCLPQTTVMLCQYHPRMLPRGGGLATLISTQLCSSEAVVHASPVEGRIFHARISLCKTQT